MKIKLQNYLKFFLLSVFLTSCNDAEKTKLYVFECGKIIVKDISSFSPGVDEGVRKELTNSCYLIAHKKGMLLWDTGLIDAIGVEGIDVWNGAFNMRVEKTLMSQLDEIGIDPEDIQYLAMSHSHGDHTGNANQFKSSTFIIQEEEYDAIFSDKAKENGFEPATYKELKNSKTIKIKGDFDVFGDGEVIIKRAIGHTPGHQMLYVNLKDTGPIMLSGDLYHFTKNRDHSRVPSFNFNKEETLKSMVEIESFIKEKKAQLWIQHDLEQNKTIKHSPSYYQ